MSTKVYTKGVRSTMPQRYAMAIFTSSGEELFRVNYWKNDKAEEAADMSIASWLKANPKYEYSEELAWQAWNNAG